MGYVIGLIIVIIIVMVIYQIAVDIFESITSFISSSLMPLANFFNINVWDLFWIIVVTLIISIISIRIFISYRKRKRVWKSNDDYDNQQRAPKERRDNQRRCPICHNYLVLRNGEYGKFWGCSDYPYCSYTEKFVVESPTPKIESVATTVEPKIAYVAPILIYRIKPALNPQEKIFKNKLENIIPASYYIQYQVPYSTIFEKSVANVDEISNKNDKRIIFCPELSYVADFVLYDKSTELPIATIEFNGVTHYERDVFEKDAKKKEICDKANLPYIAFWTQNKDKTIMYENTENYIKERLLSFAPNLKL